jgi:hypothetical protein
VTGQAYLPDRQAGKIHEFFGLEPLDRNNKPKEIVYNDYLWTGKKGVFIDHSSI